MLKNAFCSGLILAVVMLAPAFVRASEEAASQKTKALEILSEEVGNWTSRWEWLGNDGEVVGTQEGEENFEELIPGAVFLNTNIINEPRSISKSMTFYNPVQDKIFFISVGQEGDHWILSKEVGSEVLTSDLHPLPDGRKLMIRFTTLEANPDSKKILMQRSWDSGSTWEDGFFQYMTRTGTAADSTD